MPRGVSNYAAFVRSQRSCALLYHILQMLPAEIHVTCTGPTGHGSILHENTAGEKIRYVLDRFMDFRDAEKRKLAENPNYTMGDVTTINLTMLVVSILSSSIWGQLVFGMKEHSGVRPWSSEGLQIAVHRRNEKNKYVQYMPLLPSLCLSTAILCLLIRGPK